MSYALGNYDNLSDEKKTKLHEEMMKELTESIETLKQSLPKAMERYRHLKQAWTEYKNSGLLRKRKAARTRAEEIEREMEPLQLELDLERAAARVDNLRKEKADTVRKLNKEKTFQI